MEKGVTQERSDPVPSTLPLLEAPKALPANPGLLGPPVVQNT